MYAQCDFQDQINKLNEQILKKKKYVFFLIYFYHCYFSFRWHILMLWKQRMWSTYYSGINTIAYAFRFLSYAIYIYILSLVNDNCCFSNSLSTQMLYDYIHIQEYYYKNIELNSLPLSKILLSRADIFSSSYDLNLIFFCQKAQVLSRPTIKSYMTRVKEKKRPICMREHTVRERKWRQQGKKTT